MTVSTHVRAKDLMQTDVTTLSAEDTITEAIRVFEEERIHGAPVVDEQGRLVGVLSASDIVKVSHVEGGRIDAERHEYYLANPLEENLGEAPWWDEDFFSKEDYSVDVLGDKTVRDWMNPKAVFVAPEASLRKVCQTMTNERIHRVLVVDDGELKGLLSSFDVVRFLAQNL